jgi:hypothetical protein
VLDTLFPPGGRRGETITVQAAGSFSTWPVTAWMPGAGLTVTPLPEKGKLAIAVAADAPVGVHWLRLVDAEGATPLRPFLVGTLPEVVEAEPNDDPQKPQRLDTSAVTINGKLARSGDVDGFAVPLRRGQTLVAALEANRRLGAPMDGLLQVATSDGFTLAQNDDAPDRDPLIVFTAPADGLFVVRAFAFPAEPDSRIGFSGGDAYIYRLTLTTRGFLDHVYPLSVARAAQAPGPLEVEAAGWNLDPAARRLPVAVAVAADPDQPDVLRLDHPLLANAGEVQLEDHDATVEIEPNTPDHPQEIALPVTISGRIDPDRDQDVYRFAGRKSDRWQIRVESRSLGHPLDAVLKVLDASGKVLAEVDDPGSRRRNTTRDPELTFTVPADGPYRIVVRDLHGRGSFRHAYRLTATVPTASYALGLAADQFTLTPGKPLKIPVTITRDDGFNGPVQVEALGLPETVTAPRVTSSPSGTSAKSVTLELSAATSSVPWSGPFQIIGRVEQEGSGSVPRPRPARVPLPGLNGTSTHLWLTVLKPADPPSEAEAPKP